MTNLLIFIIGLFLIAALLRVDFFFYILYFLFGIYLISRVWAERALRSVEVHREYLNRAFLGDQVQIRLNIRNKSWWPLPWLRVHESLPIHLKSPNFFRSVFSLWCKEQRTLDYELDCRRRGYYDIGPLALHSGDLFGMVNYEKITAQGDYLIVYPRIVPLKSIGVPAQTPFGSVPTKQRIYEDPSRMVGVRDYQSGDSLRHIHWKTTATRGTLQVKRFEPAISIESQIFLNLNRTEYTIQRALSASELAITTAASIAHCLIEQRQTVGLASNGLDPLADPEQAQSIILPPRKGQEQLMHMLDVLARVQMGEQIPFNDLLRQARLHLTWGSTGIIITADADEPLFDNLLLMKRAGFHVILIVLDPRTAFANIKQRAQEVGIAAYEVWEERDLDVWRI
ncbi:MAG: DUF58 domain-containing protein [Chloroflexi bacterium]|jgi:uncharacterized protein (DUF58 family)|nr:DUF58 domain-containing protein [Chloroflexota bacterium]